MTDFDDVAALSTGDRGLATISVSRDDGSVHSSVVNAGTMLHPVTGENVACAVLRGPSWKLKRIRETKRCTLLFRVGWEWASVDGAVDIIGPNDTLAGFDAAAVPQLLRDVFSACGGTHDDWDEYDRVMAEDQRACVFITPERIQGRR